MNEQQPKWFSINIADSFTCPACSREITVGQSADHHPACCPKCGVECMYLNWKNRMVMILSHQAPRPFREAIQWLQTHCDELEYVQLLCTLEEISDEICQEQVTKPGTEIQSLTKR